MRIILKSIGLGIRVWGRVRVWVWGQDQGLGLGQGQGQGLGQGAGGRGGQGGAGGNSPPLLVLPLYRPPFCPFTALRFVPNLSRYGQCIHGPNIC